MRAPKHKAITWFSQGLRVRKEKRLNSSAGRQAQELTGRCPRWPTHLIASQKPGAHPWCFTFRHPPHLCISKYCAFYLKKKKKILNLFTFLHLRATIWTQATTISSLDCGHSFLTGLLTSPPFVCFNFWRGNMCTWHIQSIKWEVNILPTHPPPTQFSSLEANTVSGFFCSSQR